MKILKLLLCLFLLSCTSAQPLVDPAPDKSENLFIPATQINKYFIDKLDNHYLLSNNGILKRYNDSGIYKYEYSNRFYGLADHVDVSNPQKILLFYRDFQKIIILDNTLSEFSRIDIENFEEIGEISAACTSTDNHVWGYDISNAILHKLNFNGAIISSSNPLNIAIGRNPEYHFLIQDEQNIIAHNNLYGTDLFDQLANLKNHLNFTIQQSPQLHDNNIYFIKENKLLFTGTDDYLLKEIPLPTDLIDKASISLHDEYYYFLTSQGLDRIRIQE